MCGWQCTLLDIHDHGRCPGDICLPPAHQCRCRVTCRLKALDLPLACPSAYSAHCTIIRHFDPVFLDTGSLFLITRYLTARTTYDHVNRTRSCAALLENNQCAEHLSAQAASPPWSHIKGWPLSQNLSFQQQTFDLDTINPPRLHAIDGYTSLYVPALRIVALLAEGWGL